VGAVAAVGPLTGRDLSELGALFAARSGRPADLDRFATWIDSSPSAGARLDGALVGYATTAPFGPEVVELTSMLVAPSARGRGIGTALLGHLHDACRASGIGAVVTVTSAGYATAEPHRDAVPFYEAAGYRVAVRTEQTAVLVRSLGDEG